MANKPKTEKSGKKTTPKETRDKLNARARFDYGIINAEDMQESQLKDEIAAIDKQAKDARKANQEAAKEAKKSAQNDTQS